MQKDRAPVRLRNHKIGEVFKPRRLGEIADQIFARIVIGEAAACIGAELAQRFLDLLIAYAQRAQRVEIGRDAILPHLAANRDDLRDAGNRQQARA